MSNEIYNILLVDDDEDDAFIINTLLGEIERAIFHTHWASTYEAGLSYLHQNHWNAILVDYDLGLKNGLDFIREAVKQSIKVPMIMVTGRGRYEIDLEAMQAGATDYLSKTQLNSSSLERTIRYAIERRRAEEELEKRVAERTKELQLLLDQTPAILWCTDCNLVLISVRGHGLTSLGVSPDHLLGKTIQEAFRGLFSEDQPEILIAHQRALAGESTRFEVALANTYQSAYVEPSRDQDGTITGCIGTAFNITDRKQAENTLRATLSLFEGLFTSAPDAILLVREDGVIQRANPQAEKVFGYTISELATMVVEQLIPSRFQKNHVDHRAEYNSSPRMRPMGQGLDLFGLHKDGHEFPVDVTLSPLALDNQTYVICVVRGVSKR